MTGSKLAIIGARGVGNHGGFETVVSELAPRLVERGYEVYCSARASADGHEERQFKGVQLLRFPFSFPKTYAVGKLFEVLYDTYFVMKCRFSLRCDVVYCLGVASGLSLLALKWLGLHSAVNIDGLEWRRKKFGTLTKLFLRISFIACCIASDRMILDNSALITCVPKAFRKKTVHITYGVTKIDCHEQSQSGSFPTEHDCHGLTERGYWLVVARLEPENNIHNIMTGYLSSKSAKPLVIVGDSSSARYERTLRGLSERRGPGKRVVMTGSIHNRRVLNRLRCGCFAYVHGHSVGGTNLSLLEAMSVGNIIIAHDNVFNREVCSDAALFFSDSHSLADIMDRIDDNPIDFRELAERARGRADCTHQWDHIVTKHEELFSQMRLA